MKRILISTAAVAGLFFGVTLISNLPVRGDDNNRGPNDQEREDEGDFEVQQGFRIAPGPA